MTESAKKTILIINTVLCVIAVPVGFFVMMGAVMGGAAAQGHEELGTIIVYLGLGQPWIPIPSIIGSWATMKWTRLSMAFVALPWVYTALLFGTIGVLFAVA